MLFFEKQVDKRGFWLIFSIVNGFFGYFIWKESENLAIFGKKSGQII